MKCLMLLALALLFTPLAVSAGDKDRLYEMRTYYAAAGKLDALNARFRDHTCKLFEKHGITNIGYWTPIDNKDNKLVYIIAFPDKAAQGKSWKAFLADPDWKKAFAASEQDGKLVNKIESVFMKTTDYSPAPKASSEGKRVFELRTYAATPGKLDNLNARFRDHTCKLFEKHGITNIGYWVPTKGTDTLIYIVSHKSADAAKASWDAFRKDPDWISARKASEAKAGGSLTTKDGVRSVYMTATDYSPIK